MLWEFGWCNTRLLSVLGFGWCNTAHFGTITKQNVFSISSVPWPIGSSGGHEGRFSRDSLPVFFLQEAFVSSSGMGRYVHSLMLSIQHFLCRPRRRPLSKVPRRMVLERMLWRETCPNHASFCLLTVTRRGSCRPTRKLILPCTQQ